MDWHTSVVINLLPHVIMTLDINWDPSNYDNNIDTLEEYLEPELEFIEHNNLVDGHGEYRNRTIATHNLREEELCFDTLECTYYEDLVDDIMDAVHPTIKSNIYVATLTNVEHKPDFELLRPLFGWAPTDTIKQTFAVTTQFARGHKSDTLKQHWRSGFPACNVKRRNEPVAKDTVFSNTPAVDSGVTAAQIFVGRESLVADVYGLKTDK
jgi:hypothetical protein